MHEPLGPQLEAVWALPFVGMLLSIGLGPLLMPRRWHHSFHWIAVFWATLAAVPLVCFYPTAGVDSLLHILLLDYVPFVILLLSLYVVTGGILLRGNLAGTPAVNCTIFLVGILLASFVGTTGAAILTVRPLLRANARRAYQTHTFVFFIFLVCNIGGCLTPLADPPLFLGFLHHVPFFWPLTQLWPYLLTALAVLLPLYWMLDRYYYFRLEKPDVREPLPETERQSLEIVGAKNFLFLFGMIALILIASQIQLPFDFAGVIHQGAIVVGAVHMPLMNLVRDIGMLTLAFLALRTTKPLVYEENQFSWFPIKEVAWLFMGIFISIAPVLEILKAGNEGSFSLLTRSVNIPLDYFVMTGLLSSFLDNAPTYLAFFNLALGQYAAELSTEKEQVAFLIAHAPTTLAAISIGAVFMGANTYIGNAPNFMVRSIAEEGGVKMPNFFAYIFLYSIPILTPTFLLISWLFFWGR